MNTTRKILIGIAAAAGLYLGATAYSQEKQTEPVKVNAMQSEIITKDQRTLHRTEVVAGKMPGNSDVYMVLEQKGQGEMYKIRGQTLPITAGPASVGVAVQHVYNKKTSNDIGLVGRVQGKIEDVSTKMDVRYFPKTNAFDGYGWAAVKEFFADMLWSYDATKGNVMMRPGVDYKINDNLSIGIEGKVMGKMNGLKTDYAGLRLGVKI